MSSIGSSTGSSATGTGSNTIRITGMASGLDVDSLVKQMMAAEQTKMDKLQQSRQLIQWKQDAYRDTIGDLNTFNSTYFDVLKSDSYMLSTRNYSSFDITSTMAGNATSAVTATASSGAVAGDYIVNVSQLASKTMITGNNTYNVLQSNGALSFPDAIQITAGSNDKLNITTDGTNFYGITLDSKSYSSLSDLAADINSKLSKTDNGSDISSKVEAAVSKDGASIQILQKISIDDTNKTLNLTLGSTNYSVTLDKGNYTLDELKTQITSKLASATNLTSSKAEDISSKVSISVSHDGTQLSFNGASANPAGYSTQGLSVVNTSTAPSGVTITGNNLLFNPKITSGVNDHLTVKIGANSYNVDLGTLDYSHQSTYSDPSTFGKPLSVLNDLAAKIQAKLDNITDNNDPTKKIGDSLKVKVSMDGSKIQLAANTGSQISVYGNLIPVLGISSSSTSSIDLNQSSGSLMSSLFDNTTTNNGLVSFNINDKAFNFNFNGADKYRTIADVMSEISSQANVNISYSQLTRKFMISSNSTGSGQNIKASDSTGEFISSLFSTSNLDTSAKAYSFSLTSNLKNNDTIVIGAQTFTAGSDFSIGQDAATTAANIAARLTQSGAYIATADSSGKVTLVQKTPSSDPAPSVITNANFPSSNLTVNTDVPAAPAQFSFSLNQQFNDGDSINIDGQTYTATSSGSPQTGQFSIGTDIASTAANIAAVISASGAYSAAADASGNITLTQNTPSSQQASVSTNVLGVSSPLTVNTVTAAVPAQYSFMITQNLNQSLKAGDKLTISNHVLTAGTDFAVDTDYTKTATNISQAMQNFNDYTVTDDGAGKIIMTQKSPSSSVPNVSLNPASISTNLQVSAVISYNIGSSSIIQGQDASLTIAEPNTQPISITKSTNTFTLDGITYNLNAVTSSDVKVTLASNTQKTFDKIKAFIEAYNGVIDKLNTKLDEKKQYNYKPLTDDQKSNMKDTDITNWETKAKEGLLSGDSLLTNMVYTMRSVFYDPVKVNAGDQAGSSIGISLSSIGITTSSDISQRGKLIIDETKLKDALQNNGDKVTQLFTKVSSTVPNFSASLTSTQRQQRYSEEGLFQRISDTLQDYIRTTRDNNSRKGMLLEEAGIKGDYSEFNNLLSKELTDQDKAISDMKTKLSDKQEQYYLKFSKLETAMQQLNTQSSWLTSQLSGSNAG